MRYFLLLSIGLLSQIAAIPTISAEIFTCKKYDVRVTFNHKDGILDGISRSGIFFVVQNISDHVCQLQGIPDIYFQGLNRKGELVTAKIKHSVSEHRNSAVPWINILPGISVSSEISWATNGIYENPECIDLHSAIFSISGEDIRLPINATMCKSADSPGYFNFFIFKSEIMI